MNLMPQRQTDKWHSLYPGHVNGCINNYNSAHWFEWVIILPNCVTINYPSQMVYSQSWWIIQLKINSANILVFKGYKTFQMVSIYFFLTKVFQHLKIEALLSAQECRLKQYCTKSSSHENLQYTVTHTEYIPPIIVIFIMAIDLLILLMKYIQSVNVRVLYI